MKEIFLPNKASNKNSKKMLNFFKEKNKVQHPANTGSDFDYLEPGQYYFDSACQTLRPQQVIHAETNYYRNYNACGERVKYKWGVRVDEEVEQTREKLLQLTGKSSKEYTVVFTLNTTYGINLVLQQLPSQEFKQIVTSEIEHNSVFLPTMIWSKKNNLKRTVLARDEDGTLQFTDAELDHSILLVNTVSNIDGRTLKNLDQLAKATHKNSGILLLDGAQNFSHNTENLKNIDFDAVFGSGHKMYGPSMGFIIIKKSLIKKLDHFFLGGGTVYDVQKDSYQLINEEHELHATLELGLQNWAGIIGLGAAIDWLKNYKPGGKTREEHEKKLGQKLFSGLKAIPKLHLLNTEPRTTASFYLDHLDAHRLGLYFSEQNIMCRSGYFCCHYYLKNSRAYPPLLRISLGLHNKETDIDYFLEILDKILKAI